MGSWDQSQKLSWFLLGHMGYLVDTKGIQFFKLLQKPIYDIIFICQDAASGQYMDIKHICKPLQAIHIFGYFLCGSFNKWQK